MVEINIQYQGDLRCDATHGPSGQTLITDAPVDNHGKGESFSPTDLVATALGSCVVTIMAIYSNKIGVDLSGAAVKVEKHMSTDSPRRIVKLPVRVDVPVSLNADQREALENAARSCPVHKSISVEIDAPIEFHYPQAG